MVLVILLGAGGFTATWVLLAPKARTASDSEDYKFLHCDKCGKEIPYVEHLDQKQCQYCKDAFKGTMIATKESVAKAGDPWRWFTIATSFEAVGLFGLVVYLLYQVPKDPDAEFEHFKCPYCRQKLRYPQTSAGKGGMCPRCKRRFIFPEEPILEEA